MAHWYSYHGLLSLFFVAGLLLFTRGFLLTRLELRRRSAASDLQGTRYEQARTLVDSTSIAQHVTASIAASSRKLQDGLQDPGHAVADDERRRGWSPALYDRLVFIVIDAWRHSFASDPTRMPRLHALLSTHPRHAALYEAVADAPTVTLQRLKGMLTGSLPTFIDISANFHSSTLEEDNWLSQWRMLHHGSGAGVGGQAARAVFMGDDTWMGLFPGNDTFHTAYPFPSFDVWDLHTVDEGIGAHLLPTLRRGEWGAVVAHYLGLDHAGHRYHARHPSIGDKLELMDRSIEEVVRELQALACPQGSEGAACTESILLVVTGDHGMTEDGNHGGASAEETSTGLLAVSVGRRSLLPLPPHHVLPPSLPRKARRVHQIDLVPTLSLALGLPIPFPSLGHVLGEWDWSPRGHGEGAGACSDEQSTLAAQLMGEYYRARALLVNAWQVHRYSEAYAAAAPSFASQPGMQQAAAQYSKVEQLWQEVLGRTVAVLQGSGHGGGDEQAALNTLSSLCSRHGPAPPPEAAAMHALLLSYRHAQEEASAYVQGVAEVCRALWTQFDLGSMLGGVLVMASCVACQGHLSLAALRPVLRSSPTVPWSVAVLQACAWPAWTSLAALCILTARLVCLFGDTCLGVEGSWVCSLTALALGVVLLDCARLWLLMSGGEGGDKAVRKVAFIARLAGIACLAVLCLSTGQAGITTATSTVTASLPAAPSLPVTADSMEQLGLLTTALPLLVGPWLLLYLLLPSLLAPVMGQGLAIGGRVSEGSSARVWLVGTVLGLAVLFQWVIQAGGLSAWLPPGHDRWLCLLLPRCLFACSAAAAVVLPQRGSPSSAPFIASLHSSVLLLPPLALVLGPWSPLPLLCLCCLCACTCALLAGWCALLGQAERGKGGGTMGLQHASSAPGAAALHALLHSPYPLAATLLSCLLPALAYSITGHRYQFNVLVYQAGFVGLDSFSFTLSGALLAWHTFGPGHVLVLACWGRALPSLLLLRTTTPPGSTSEHALSALLTLPVMLTAFCTAVCAAVLRRHLMVWAIFAPRFCFEAVSCLLSLAVRHAPYGRGEMVGKACSVPDPGRAP